MIISLLFSDSVAVPGFPYGGMENWGLISYGPGRFLYTGGSSSTLNKERICRIIAHELAHQVSINTYFRTVRQQTSFWGLFAIFKHRQFRNKELKVHFNKNIVA